MPGLTGLEVAQGIEGRTRVVFVTAYDEFAVAAFEQQALDYVLKPVKAERLARTVERLQRDARPRRRRARTRPAADRRRRRAPGLAAVLQPAARRRAARHAAALRARQPGRARCTRSTSTTCSSSTPTTSTPACAPPRAEHLIRTTDHRARRRSSTPSASSQVHRSTIVNLDHLAGTRRDELSRLFVRMRGHAGELPVSRAYVHLFKAM